MGGNQAEVNEDVKQGDESERKLDEIEKAFAMSDEDFYSSY